MDAGLQERLHKPPYWLLTCRTPGCPCRDYTLADVTYTQLTPEEWAAYSSVGMPARIAQQ